MKIHIGKADETLEQIANENNVPYEVLIQYNKAYVHRLNLEGCTIVIPSSELEETRNESSNEKPAILIIDNEQRLEPLINAATEYSYLLKELIITKYNNPDYSLVIFSSIKEKEENIKHILSKEKTSNPLAISQAQEYKDFASTILLLIGAIKTHGIEEVKKQLQHIKNWPNKVVILYKNDLSRDNKLKGILENIGEKWRDYVIKYGAQKYKECEDLFNDILNKLKDFSINILSKE